MAAFQFKTYYKPRYISPMTNAVWGVISVTANEMVEQTQDTIISLICDVPARCRARNSIA
jgi:hypothetical protein